MRQDAGQEVRQDFRHEVTRFQEEVRQIALKEV
jgi:hypothetical protein